MKLLYRTAEWHGLAKLRMHTESSLTLLEALTTEFGLLMQSFQELTSRDLIAVELPKEKEARNRKAKKASSSGSGTAQVSNDTHPAAGPGSTGSDPTRDIAPSKGLAENPGNSKSRHQPILPDQAYSNDKLVSVEAPSSSSGGRKLRILSLSTIKYHFLGDYVHSIRLWEPLTHIQRNW